MGARKSLGLKKRLIHAADTAKPAPRWADVKKFGLRRSTSRSIKRMSSRSWRRTKLKE